MKSVSDFEQSTLKAMASKSFSEAASGFFKLTQSEPHVARHHYHLGLCYMECQNLEAAVSSLKASVRLDPLLQKAWYALGSLVRHVDGDEAASPFWREGYFANPFSKDGASLWNEIQPTLLKES